MFRITIIDNKHVQVNVQSLSSFEDAITIAESLIAKSSTTITLTNRDREKKSFIFECDQPRTTLLDDLRTLHENCEYQDEVQGLLIFPDSEKSSAISSQASELMKVQESEEKEKQSRKRKRTSKESNKPKKKQHSKFSGKNTTRSEDSAKRIKPQSTVTILEGKKPYIKYDPKIHGPDAKTRKVRMTDYQHHKPVHSETGQSLEGLALTQALANGTFIMRNQFFSSPAYKKQLVYAKHGYRAVGFTEQELAIEREKKTIVTREEYLKNKSKSKKIKNRKEQQGALVYSYDGVPVGEELSGENKEQAIRHQIVIKKRKYTDGVFIYAHNLKIVNNPFNQYFSLILPIETRINRSDFNNRLIDGTIEYRRNKAFVKNGKEKNQLRGIDRRDAIIQGTLTTKAQKKKSKKSIEKKSKYIEVVKYESKENKKKKFVIAFNPDIHPKGTKTERILRREFYQLQAVHSETGEVLEGTKFKDGIKFEDALNENKLIARTQFYKTPCYLEQYVKAHNGKLCKNQNPEPKTIDDGWVLKRSEFQTTFYCDMTTKQLVVAPEEIKTGIREKILKKVNKVDLVVTRSGIPIQSVKRYEKMKDLKKAIKDGKVITKQLYEERQNQISTSVADKSEVSESLSQDTPMEMDQGQEESRTPMNQKEEEQQVPMELSEESSAAEQLQEQRAEESTDAFAEKNLSQQQSSLLPPIDFVLQQSGFLPPLLHLQQPGFLPPISAILQSRQLPATSPTEQRPLPSVIQPFSPRLFGSPARATISTPTPQSASQNQSGVNNSPGEHDFKKLG